MRVAGFFDNCMTEFKNILLASHGTDGARAAERAAVSLCASNTSIHHLIVVPDLWKGMMGDDWLNSGATRDTYGRYLETELGKEIDNHIERLSSMLSRRNISYSHTIIIGKPEKCLLQVSQAESFDLVVIGSPRPGSMKGLRSRMKLEPLVRSLTIPLFIAAFPNI